MVIFRLHISAPSPHGVGRAIFTPISTVAGRLTMRRWAQGSMLQAMLIGGALLMVGIAAGALLSANGQTMSGQVGQIAAPITSQSGGEVVESAIGRLEIEQLDLKKNIAAQSTQLNDLRGAGAERKAVLLDLQKELDRQRVASGLVALQGQGIIATFDDSTVSAIPDNEDPSKYILHEYDLRDILNTLWAAGAEAVSLNGERIVGNTSVYCVGSTIMCNTIRLSPPYEIHAIGDADALAAALRESPQMTKFNLHAQIYELPVKIQKGEDVLVAAYNGSFAFKYASIEK